MMHIIGELLAAVVGIAGLEKPLLDGPQRPAAVGEGPCTGRFCEPTIGQDEE